MAAALVGVRSMRDDGPRVPSGTVIGDVDVGGLAPDVARAAVERHAARVRERGVSITLDGVSAQPIHVSGRELGARPLVDAAFEDAGDRGALSSALDRVGIHRTRQVPLRFALAPGLEDGMAVAYANRGSGGGAAAPTRSATLATARPRPAPAAMLELHTLQALDATLAGASLREVAEGLFGADAVAADWHADGDLRARVRRMVRRGNALMRGGYRRLAQLPPLEKGRFDGDAKRP